MNLVVNCLDAHMGTGGPDDNAAQANHLVAFGGNNTQGPIDVATACNAKGGSGRMDFESETFIAHTLRAEGFDASEDGTGRGTPIVPVIAFNSCESQSSGECNDISPTLRNGSGKGGATMPAVAYAIQERAVSEKESSGPQGLGVQADIGYTLESRHHVEAIAFDPRQVTSKENRSNPQPGAPCPTMHEQPAAIAYRTSGNCGVTEQGDKTAALTTATDPNANIVAYQCQGTNVGPMGTLRQGNGNVPFVFQTRCSRNGRGMPDEVAPALTSAECGSHADTRPHIAGGGMAVRRLLPVETERLQGFPDGWSEWGIDENGERVNQSDSARYKQMGNAVCCNVALWLGRRLMEYAE